MAFAADAGVMEKVWECGLMLFGDATIQEWKIRIGESFLTAYHGARIVAVLILRPDGGRFIGIERHVLDQHAVARLLIMECSTQR